MAKLIGLGCGIIFWSVIAWGVEPSPEQIREDLPELPPKFLHHEVYLSNVEGLVGFTSSGHKLSTGIGYDYTIVPGLQWGLSANFSHRSQDRDRETYLEILIGPTLSVPIHGDPRNAWFFRSGLGAVYDNFDLPASDKRDNYLKFASSVEFGKRFHLLSSLVYRPSIQLLTVFGSSARERFAFNIRFLSFSGMF